MESSLKYVFSIHPLVLSVFVILLTIILVPDLVLADGDMESPDVDIKKNSDIYDMNRNLEAAAQGNAIAQNKVGLMYYQGLGTKRDYIEALKWFNKSANQGYADAQYNLGKMYYFEIGIMGSNHDSDALTWFQKAAEQGHIAAQFAIGMMYYDGSGVPVNYAKAMLWFQKAASLGHAQAQNLVGVQYETGLGVTKDYSEAKLWYQKSAAQGCWDAMNNLARLEHQTNLPIQISRISTDESLLEKNHETEQEQKYLSQSDRYYESCTYTRKECQTSCALSGILGLALVLSGKNINSSSDSECNRCFSYTNVCKNNPSSH